MYSSYGDSVEINILSPKTCGIVGSILLIASLYFPVVNLSYSYMGYSDSGNIYWKDNTWNYVAIAAIIIFYWLSIWVDQKWFMIIVGIGLVRQIYYLVKNFNEAQDMISGMNSYFGSGTMKVTPGIAMFLFIVATISLFIGVFLSYKGE